jgi:hypothetical protein
MCQPAVVCSAGDARHDCFVMGLFLIHWSSHCELRFAIVGCLFLTTLHPRVYFLQWSLPWTLFHAFVRICIVASRLSTDLHVRPPAHFLTRLKSTDSKIKTLTPPPWELTRVTTCSERTVTEAETGVPSSHRVAIWGCSELSRKWIVLRRVGRESTEDALLTITS